MYRIVIDQSLCSGFGDCADLAPEVFELEREGRAFLRVGESDDPAVLDAAASGFASMLNALDRPPAFLPFRRLLDGLLRSRFCIIGVQQQHQSLRVGESDDPAVLDAAAACPMGAISVVDVQAA